MKRRLPPLPPVLLLLVALPAAGFAAGTPSGTDIDNTAVLDYKVGGVDQSQVASNTATFKVDNKVDLTVAAVDVAIVTTVPGAQDQVLTYTVTNNGNTVQDFSLTATDSPTGAFGETESFNASNVGVFADANGNGIYDPGTDTGTYLDEVEPDSSRTVFVVADMPLTGIGDGDVASYDLTAQVAGGGSPGSQGSDITGDDAASADDPNTVQIVFADGAGTADSANDGQHSDLDGYKIVTATMTAAKADSVVSDPINGATNPKAIPGATVRYTIDVDNSGSASASDVTVVDDVPANTAFVVGSAATTPAVGPVIEYSDDGGATWTYSPSADPDGSDTAVTHVRITFSSIAAGGSGQAVFHVLIL